MYLQRILLISLLLSLGGNAQPSSSAEFDVASIKLNKTGSNSSRISSNHGVWKATNITVKALLLNAYEILPEQIVGAPAWIDLETYDVEARAELDPAVKLSQAEESSQFRLRLQALLASRFQFTMHRETKEWQTYALVVGKKGQKLTPAEKREGGNSMRVSNGHMEATGLTMDSLARSLSGWLGRPTINETAIEGKFDLTLDFEPDRPARTGDKDNPIAGVDVSKPSLFTAVQDQLGLKLESRRALVELLVVDRIERPNKN